MDKSSLGHIKHSIFAQAQSAKNNFSFLSDDFYLDQLHSEFLSLYQLFLSNKDNWKKHPEIFLYTSYICNLIITYYENDYTSSELEQFKRMAEELHDFINNHLLNENSEFIDTIPDFLFKKIKHTTHKYPSTLRNLSKLSDKVGDLNGKRSQFAYSRNLATYIAAFMQKNAFGELFREFNNIFGNQFNFEDGIKFLESSRFAVSLIGALLFSFHFIVNLIIILKHMIQAIFLQNLSKRKILKQELEKRGFIMTSDLVWAIITLLTTCNNFFQIPGAAISPLVLSFLVFDALLLLAEWLFMFTRYNQRLQDLTMQLEIATPLEKNIITRQIDLLHDEWKAQSAYFAINVLGAVIIASCFAVTMLYSGPFTLACMALFSMLGNALYNTSVEYKKYCRTKASLNREIANGLVLDDIHHQLLITLLEAECVKVRSTFWKELIFNVGGIAFIITAAIASWPVALSLTIAYIGYQLHKAHQQKADKNKHEVLYDIYRFIDEPALVCENNEISCERLSFVAC